MKKRMTVVFSMLLVLVLSACGQGTGTTGEEGTAKPTATTAPVEESEPTTAPVEENEPTDVPDGNEWQEESLSESKQALAEFQEEIQADGSLCAVAYLGCQSVDFTEFYSWLEVAEFLTEYPFLEELTEDNTILAAGEEWYVVVPADNSVTLTVNETVLDETEYILKAGKELLQVSDGGLVLLRGNVSDIMPNLMVTAVTDSGETIEYCPALSLRDGYLQFAEGVYDFTSYDWFMEPEENFVAAIQAYRADNILEEWKDGTLLSSGSRVTLCLGEEAAALYPELAGELATLAEEDLDDLKYNVELLRQYARTDEKQGYYDNGSTVVQRADETVFSIRQTFYEYSGGLHPNNYTTSLNLDPEFGGWYALEDIISDTSVLLSMIEERLFEKYPAEIFFAEKGNVLADYATEELVWTLGYQGITFYFSPVDIAPYVEGTLTATIWFDEVPELFYEEYTYAPEQGHAFCFFAGEEIEFDQNLSDAQRDVLAVNCEAAGADGYETINIRYNGEVYEETEFSFHEMNPYLVCSGKPGCENYFLYLELLKDEERFLCVYDLNGEGITRTEVVYNVVFDGFWSTEAGNEVYYEELLLKPFEY